MFGKWLAGFALLFASPGALTGGEDIGTADLIESRQIAPTLPDVSPKWFWSQTADGLSFQDGEIRFAAGENGKTGAGFGINLGNVTWESLKLSFSYRVEGGKGVVFASLRDESGKYMKEKSKTLDAHADWKAASLEIPFAKGAGVIWLDFRIDGKGAKLSVKDLSLRPTLPPRGAGRVAIQNGKDTVPCSGICIVKSAPFSEYYDKDAAATLRKYIYDACGEVLPLEYIDPDSTLKPGMIVIGKAAELKGSPIAKDAMAALKDGGYAIAVSGGVVAMAGKTPAGTVSGAYALVERLLDVVFVSTAETEPEIGKVERPVFKEGAFSSSPAFELRLLREAESLGYTDRAYIGDARLIGCKSAGTCHTAEGLLSFDEYGASHPEYFALGKDGKRLHKDPNYTRFDIHFCMSNPDVQRIIGERMAKWMDVCPQGRYFYLTFGDGAGKSCQCESCKAMGSPSDRNIKFVNSIAAKTAETHPDKIIMTLAYVDTETPPTNERPLSNVKVLYCPYPMSWSNHLESFCPENKEGIASLNGWLERCPGRMYIFDYPNCCPEVMNLWPAFHANLDRIRYYDAKGANGLVFCGLQRKRSGFPGFNIFNAMSRYVLGKALWNPGLNADKEVDAFMRLYYGPAAPQMRELFDLLRQEVKSRNFVQHTEEVKRGFVTKELAAKAYAIFAKAEAATANSPKHSDRVAVEKTYLLFSDLSDRCRTNGNIEASGLPEYATHLAEFAKLCRKFEINYFSRANTPAEWFWNTALLKLEGKGPWLKSKKLDELMAKPLETVEGSIPSCQARNENGWTIPMTGVGGGIAFASYSAKSGQRKGVKVLRRPSSGYGYMLANLQLDAAPSGKSELLLEGIKSENAGAASMRLAVNGKTVYEGSCPFVQGEWQWKGFEIPEGVLTQGRNLIEFRNTTPEEEDAGDDKKAVDYIVGKKRNYFWGWYMLSGIKIKLEK